MTKYYPSAKSKKIGGILWGLLLGGFGISMYTIIIHFSVTNLIIVLIIFIFAFLFAGVVWFRTGYFVTKGYLVIKIGPITHSRIQISRISNVSRSSSILSSPANSLNRLSIKYDRKGLVLISPKNEADFINAIKEENSKVIVNI